ncbi:BTAD domain-containing putative transcriptional regulator [Amycolatopsis sp. NPDC054798]
MEFLVLGPLEVRLSGQSVGIPGARQQKLLALLLLAANRLVPVERLVEELWDEPPQSARQQIHNAIGSLRRQLTTSPPDVRLESDGSGYRLAIPISSLDMHQFNSHLQLARQAELKGRPREAIELFQASLELWRGSAFSGLHANAIDTAATNLEEQRMSAIEDLMALRLKLGQARSIVGELRQLVTDNPLRESLRGHLMLALHACSRQADALAVYEEGRKILADELGIDPTPHIRQLHSSILRGEIHADSNRPTHQVVDETPAGPNPRLPTRENAYSRRSYLPRDIMDFSGRSAEISQLLTAVHSAEPTALVISAIDGMGGIGKTTLAVHLAWHIADEYPDGQYFADLHGFSPGLDPVTPEQALDNLLRDSGVPPELIPPTLEARSALWRAHLANQRALVVLDNAIDAHHVRPLLPGAADVLVLVTSRRKLTALDGAVPLSLDVLPQEDAVTIFNRVANRSRPDEESDAVAEVVDLCGRLPLAIRVAAARLRNRPTWKVADLVDRLTDHAKRIRFLETRDRSVMAALRLSYRYLQPDEQKLFRLLGLHPGKDFDAYTAAAMTGFSVEQAEHCLESLYDDNLLRQRVAGRFYFHDLVRDCSRQISLEFEDPSERKKTLMRALDYYWNCAVTWSKDLVNPVRDALPTIDSTALGTTREDCNKTPAEILNIEYENLMGIARFAFENDLYEHAWRLPCILFPLFAQRNNYGGESFSLLQGALEAARALADKPGESACLQALAEVCRERKSFTEAKAYLDQSLAIARSIDDRRRQASVLVAQGTLAVDEDRLGEAHTAYNSAEELLKKSDPESPIHTSIANNLGVICRDLGDFDEALRYLHRSIQILPHGEHSRRRLSRLWCIATVLHYQRKHREAIKEFELILSESSSEGYKKGQALALLGLCQAYRSIGRSMEAVDFGRRALSTAREFGFRKIECESLNALGEASFALKKIEHAEQVYEQARERAVAYESKRYEARAWEGFAHIALSRGRAVDAGQHWRKAVELYPDNMIDADFARHHLRFIDDRSTICFRCMPHDE